VPAPKKPRKSRKAVPQPRGLAAAETIAEPPADVRALAAQIAEDGGAALATYREPFGGNWVVLAALPLDKVEPAEYQRDISKPHVQRLATVIEKLDRFLDPAIAVRVGGKYLVPNGNHRCQAMRMLGARTVMALVVPDPEVAYKILALNTEKAHALREKSLEVARMERTMAGAGDRRRETDLVLEFEDPALLTLGYAYELHGRLAGSAYHSVLRRIDNFFEEPVGKSVPLREERAQALLALDKVVADVVEQMKARGFQSQFLRSFVVARVNPLRFKRGARAEFDETIEKMRQSALKMDVGKIRPQDIQRAAGPPAAPEEG
jgi:ParB family transcriptional regulator, chromosome partitioning protein